MNDQKLTTLLKDRGNVLSGFSGGGNINFSVKTGATGSALITAYGQATARTSDMYQGGTQTLGLYDGSSSLRSVNFLVIEANNGGTAESGNPFFQYALTGQKPNTTISGFSVRLLLNPLTAYANYVGYSVIPF